MIDAIGSKACQQAPVQQASVAGATSDIPKDTDTTKAGGASQQTPPATDTAGAAGQSVAGAAQVPGNEGILGKLQELLATLREMLDSMMKGATDTAGANGGPGQTPDKTPEQNPTQTPVQQNDNCCDEEGKATGGGAAQKTLPDASNQHGAHAAPAASTTGSTTSGIDGFINQAQTLLQEGQRFLTGGGTNTGTGSSTGGGAAPNPAPAPAVVSPTPAPAAAAPAPAPAATAPAATTNSQDLSTYINNPQNFLWGADPNTQTGRDQAALRVFLGLGATPGSTA